MGAETVKYCESSLKLESHDALALGESTASCMRKAHMTRMPITSSFLSCLVRDTFALAAMCCEWTEKEV